MCSSCRSTNHNLGTLAQTNGDVLLDWRVVNICGFAPLTSPAHPPHPLAWIESSGRWPSNVLPAMTQHTARCWRSRNASPVRSASPLSGRVEHGHARLNVDNWCLHAHPPITLLEYCMPHLQETRKLQNASLSQHQNQSEEIHRVSLFKDNLWTNPDKTKVKL